MMTIRQLINILENLSLLDDEAPVEMEIQLSDRDGELSFACAEICGVCVTSGGKIFFSGIQD